MPRLPVLSQKDGFPKGREIIAALQKIGYAQTRQRGSHIRLECQGRKSITVPNHIVGKGLLRKILRDAELTPEQFEELLD